MTHLRLSIAGIPLQIESGSRALLERLGEAYHGFITDSGDGIEAAPFPVRVEIDRDAEPQMHLVPPVGFEKDRITFDLPGYHGIIDPARGGRLKIASPSPVRAVDYFLRVVAGALAYAAGGLMLHAACVVRNGRGFVFFGRSGSGKTTVARNAGDGLVLNDDLVILLPAAVGWTVHGTPFTNPSQTRPSAGVAPVAALLHLVQSPQVFVEPLSSARALAELVVCVPILNASPEPPLDRCRAILQSIPAFDLHLRPDSSFWEVIEPIGL
ncbi:MAG TPA: hypothetical protein VMN57_04355 [Anaerolineales bacterium]|nr:hypothetical protein [Anaerolineales bacterium]